MYDPSFKHVKILELQYISKSELSNSLIGGAFVYIVNL